ncbi:hypothetical protein IQ07DRAFT_585485 [Pyrenochaeta sp. DS3sAY3a]|nr:hypothetical protein IQ07DRAFT_585485 [Pyrenochaeta sp. DS3sAY3a]
MDKKRLRGMIEQREYQCESEATQRRKQLSSTIQRALSTTNLPQSNQKLVYEHTKIAGNAVYALISDVVDASHGVINEYQRLENLITDLRNENAKPVAETWKQDIAEVEERLKLGARVAVRNVKKVLGAAIEDTGGDEGDQGEDLDGGIGLQDRELDYGLQTSLKYAERGVKRMVKGIPVDESY